MSTKRPISVPGVEMKVVERATCFANKDAMGPALMPYQVGVAISGGLTMLTAATEAELRVGGRRLRKLDEDIKNCFCEIDRVGMLEDLLDSEQLLGTDFSHLAPYMQMAYGTDAKYGGRLGIRAR
eukprot:SAG11_NODE_4947_length_1712_cov_3.743335_1_plen_125_part_00